MEEQSYWRVLNNRISRRRLIQGTVVGGLGLAVGGATGCGEQKSSASAIATAGGTVPSAAPSPTTLANAPRKGGTLKAWFPLDVTSLDTHISISGGDDPYLWLIYDGLFSLSPQDNSPIPELAESVEITPDGLTYSFKLRKGVKFHDGTDFNADAVKANWDRAMDPATGSFIRTTLTPILDQYKAVDPNTLQMKLKTPYSPLIASLAGRLGQIMSPKQLDKLGKDFTTQPIGAGRFKLKSRVTQSRFDVERFPDYYDQTKPYLDAISVQISPDTNVAFTSFLAGELDTCGLPYDQVDPIKKTGKYTVLTGSTNTFGHFLFNCTSGVFKDIRLRQAVSAAINREALLDVTQFGFGRAMKNIVTEDSWAFNPNKNYYKCDKDLARRLLAEAGMPNGFKFKAIGFTFYPCPQRTTAIQAQLKELGIEMDAQNLEIAEGIKQAQAGNYDVLNFTYDDPADPHAYFDGNYNTQYAKQANQYLRIPDGPEIKKVEDLIVQGVRETDQKKRQQIYWQIEDIVNDQMWTCGLVQHPYVSVVQKKVQGARTWPDGKAHWRDLWLSA